MLGCDTNILFCALEATRPEHAAARAFLETQTTNPDFVLCELVLAELYVLLRNPATSRRPLDAPSAVAIIQRLRTNPRWRLVDHPGMGSGLMEAVWARAAGPDFARRRIYDTRLALTLRHHGVTEFATANDKDFQDYGFTRVWDPLVA